MIRTKRLAIGAFFLGWLFVFGAWMCDGAQWLPLREAVMQWPFLSFLRGRNESVSQLLIGNSVGAFSVSFGFVIEYLGQMTELKDELERVYLHLSKKCFSRILYEANSFDFDYDAVEEITAYIMDHYYLLKNYSPFSVKVRVAIRKFFRKITRKKETVYMHADDLHALIVSVISYLLRYFLFLYDNQSNIRCAERVMEIAKEKYNNRDPEDFLADQYKTYYVMMKDSKEVHTNRLISRFPYNNKNTRDFPDKHELRKVIDEINLRLSAQRVVGQYAFVHKFLPMESIVEDKDIFFDMDDEEIKLMMDLEEVKNECNKIGDHIP